MASFLRHAVGIYMCVCVCVCVCVCMWLQRGARPLCVETSRENDGRGRRLQPRVNQVSSSTVSNVFRQSAAHLLAGICLHLFCLVHPLTKALHTLPTRVSFWTRVVCTELNSVIFTARAMLSAVLGVVILSVCPSVTRAL